ncbi:LAQU0S04e02256g1_1 [Lachancea quebecensis]|uniref:LAQU0S04e02256g1_1 n=1 Tax=Lachancea quebecensis TaxID=1654605 RepID=A0A0P1KSC9_9SACH|nr:LAQU0S04e02256g1_1 [Lachancea quebecensis]
MATEGPSSAETDEVYSDLYSAYSQLTDTTAKDIDHRRYPLNCKTVKIYLVASIGGLLFGYDTGVIAGVLLGLKPQDIGLSTLSDFDKELITGITSIGSVLGSVVAFPTADFLGRKIALALCSVIFCTAAAVMALSASLFVLVTGRFIVGVAVGIAAQCVPVYLSEVSPSSVRGSVMTINSSAITGGQLVACVVAWMMSSEPHSWRYLFGLSAIPAVILMCLLKFIPESPRWLLLDGKPQLAREALEIIYADASELEISNKLLKMVRDLTKLRCYQDENQPLINRAPGFNKRFGSNSSLDHVSSARNPPSSDRSVQKPTMPKKHKMEPRTRRALFVGCILMFFQQATGFNAFVYYSPVILSRIGASDPLLPAIAIATVNFVFTGVAMQVVDHWGRRSTLLHTIWIMVLGLIVGSVGLQYSNPVLFLTSLLVYVAGYASGLGSIPWMSVEFLPLNQRSLGASIIACTNWLTNFGISISFLSTMTFVGGQTSMLIFAAITAFSWLFVCFCYPEVKGLSLEEIGQVFEEGIDIHYVYRKYH